jgi:hypothetical protein
VKGIKMRWNIGQRLEFIDFRLYWEGRINRKDLIEFFGISIPQASTDLRKYQEKAPKNIEYDKSGKFYFATSNFKPAFVSSDSSDYLAQLRLISDKIYKEGESFIGDFPSFDSIPNPTRSVDPEILREVLKAINGKMSLKIEYQSMSRPVPMWRRIVPHTLAYNGHRWHIRAFDYGRKMFLDFLFARILNVKDPRPEEIDSSADIRWHSFIELKIAPHPDLTETQKRIIEKDYAMINGTKSINVRAALYFYLEKGLGLDEGCEKRPPQQQQIILVNREEISEQRRNLETYSKSL